ncbi:hypothetical protein DSECCO2_410600 [anaerobic digester metagenome]
MAAKETVPKREINTRLRVLNLSIISFDLEKKRITAVSPSSEEANVIIIGPHFLDTAVIFWSSVTATQSLPVIFTFTLNR